MCNLSDLRLKTRIKRIFRYNKYSLISDFKNANYNKFVLKMTMVNFEKLKELMIFISMIILAKEVFKLQSIFDFNIINIFFVIGKITLLFLVFFTSHWVVARFDVNFKKKRGII